MTLTRRNTPPAVYGTRDFLTLLAEREAALGLARQAQQQAGLDVADVTPATPEPEPVASSAPDGADDDHDKWRNDYLERPGLLGQYTMRSQWGDGRIIHVCGQPAAHVAAGQWLLDGRMSAGQGYVCAMCHPTVARQWGKGAR